MGEQMLLQKLTANQYCVQMIDAFEGPQYCHIVMEQCTCSLLEAFLKSTKNGHVVTEEELAHAFQCMLCGVHHLHSCGIVHRDIKPDNLLLAGGRSLSTRPVVKVCDLGLAAKLPAKSMLTDVCGTEQYMAPEMLKADGYSSEVDLWSCGVTAYLLLLGDFPYRKPDVGPKQKAILDAMRPTTHKGSEVRLPKGIGSASFKARNGFEQPSVPAIKFLTSLLKRDPMIRASCKSALCSEYIRKSMQPTQATSLGPTSDGLLVKCEQVPHDSAVSADESTDCESSDSVVAMPPRCYEIVSL